MYSRDGHCRFIDDCKRIVLFTSQQSEEGVHRVTTLDLEQGAIQNKVDIKVEHYGLLDLVLDTAGGRMLFTDCGGTSHLFAYPACRRIQSVNFDPSTFASRGAQSHWKTFSPDGAEIWEVCGYDAPTGYREYLTAFETNSGKGIRRRPPNAGTHIDGLRLSPDGSCLLVVEEKILRLCAPNSWDENKSIDVSSVIRKGWGRSYPAIAYAPNSQWIAISCEYNTKVCVVDLTRTQEASVFDVDKDFCVRLMTFSPDSRYLAIASYDMQNQVRVWNFAQLTNQAFG